MGQPVAKAKPKQTSSSRPSSTTTSIPYQERIWIDVEPRALDKKCVGVATLMIRLLRNDDSVHREEDGAVKRQDLVPIYAWRV